MSSAIETTRDIARGETMPRWVERSGVIQSATVGLRHAEKAAKIHEVLTAFCADLYRFEDGVPIIVDPNNDYRILTYIPWTHEWRAPNKPALIVTERWALRRLIREAQEADTTSLLINAGAYYYASVDLYNTFADAKKWIDSLNINAGTFRRLDSLRRASKRK